MSYHVQQQPQQKSLGIFIVIAFHVLFVWGFINGLKISKIITEPAPVTVTNLPQKAIPPAPQIIEAPRFQSTVTMTIPQPEAVTIDNPTDSLPTSATSIDTGTGGTVLATPTRPKALKTTLPEYPNASKRLGEEGVTGLRLFVTAEGKITDVQLDSSSGYARLDDAAVKHVLRNWAYTACTENGKAVACWFTTKLRWKLEDAQR